MNTEEVFNNFFRDLQNAFPELITQTTIDIDASVEHIEKTFVPQCIKIVKKDESFFTESDRILFGVNLSSAWKAEGITDETKAAIWNHILTSMISCLFHGDIKKKIETFISAAKSMWSGSTDEKSKEISRILEDKASESRIQEFIEYLLNTRLAKTFVKIVEEFDFSDLDFKIDNADSLMTMIQNPEHPTIKALTTKIGNILQEKMRRGEFTQNQIVTEIESIKAKAVSIFGSVFEDALGIGNAGAGTPSAVLMGNSPEARRQRMIARLQKKQQKKNNSS